MQKFCECGCGNPAPIATKTYKKWGHIPGQPTRFIKGHATKGKKYSPEIARRIAEGNKKTRFKKGHKVFWDVVKYIRLYQNGKKHWHWKGGITKDVMKVRNSKKYIDWRNAIFNRDNWTCKICGKRGCYLEADHIISFSILFKKKDWTMMWNIDNGRTLCRPCHDKTKDNHERSI